MYQEDTYFREISEALQHPDQVSPKQLARAKNYQFQDGKIYLRKEHRLAIPDNKELRVKILQEYHNIPISGHVGIEKTYENIAKFLLA